MVPVRRFLRHSTLQLLVVGVRGTGKATWIADNFPDADMVDLAEPVTFQEMRGHPDRLLQRASHSDGRRMVRICDVHQCPELLGVARRGVEVGAFAGYAASASSLRGLGDELRDASPELRTLHPLMAAEMGDAFRLESALHFGMLPEVVAAADPEKELKTTVALILREDLRGAGPVRDAGAFVRFLEAASFAHAEVLNLAAVARDCRLSRTTAEACLEDLEESLLAWRLPVFGEERRRGLASHPRFFLFDTGFFRAVRPSADRPGRIEDAALQGLVGQHLRAWCDYTAGRHEMFHWMTRSGLSVDFVVQGDTGLFALDVRNTLAVKPEDLRGLRAFGKRHPESRRVLLHRGTEHGERDGVLCLPCEDFLRGLTPG